MPVFIRLHLANQLDCQTAYFTLTMPGHFERGSVSNRTGWLGDSRNPAWYQWKRGHKGKNRGVKNRFAELWVFYTLFLI